MNLVRYRKSFPLDERLRGRWISIMEINELYLEIRRRGPILLEAFDDDYMICCDGKISSTPTYLLDRYFSKKRAGESSTAIAKKLYLAIRSFRPDKPDRWVDLREQVYKFCSVPLEREYFYIKYFWEKEMKIPYECIDPEIRTLIETLNNSKYLSTEGCCIGHGTDPISWIVFNVVNQRK
jgi:hypothetical protein